MTKAFPAIESIYKVIDRKPEIGDQDNLGKTLTNFTGHIKLEHVYFFYPQRPEVTVFENFSLNV